MGDARVLAKVDAFIQDHLLEVSEQEDFLKLPRLKVLASKCPFAPTLKLASIGGLKLNNIYWIKL